MMHGCKAEHRSKVRQQGVDAERRSKWAAVTALRTLTYCTKPSQTASRMKGAAIQEIKDRRPFEGWSLRRLAQSGAIVTRSVGLASIVQELLRPLAGLNRNVPKKQPARHVATQFTHPHAGPGLASMPRCGRCARRWSAVV